jgi:hypothetical protein
MLLPLALLVVVIGGMAGLLMLTEWLDSRLADDGISVEATGEVEVASTGTTIAA